MSAFLITALLVAFANSHTDVELLTTAEGAFAEGLRQRENGDRGAAAFRRAAAAYDELRRRGADNADLYRNLGNAHRLAGDLPRAILAYRTGLRLAPADADLLANLVHAREQVVFAASSSLGRPVEEVRPRWIRAFSPSWAFAVALGAYAAACVGLTRWWMLRRGAYLVTAVALLVLAAAWAGWVVAREWAGPPRSIVVMARDGVLLRKGNGAAFPPWFDTPLNRGVEAEVVYERSGWLQVELPGGELGWVSAAEVVGL